MLHPIHSSTLHYLRLVAALVVALCLTSCLRYTPSRSELEERYNTSEKASLDIAGEIEFAAYEHTLQTRLHKLVEERLQFLNGPSATASGYGVGAGDVLQVKVFGFGDLQSDAEVSAAGSVSLPLIGEFEVAGLDLPAVRKKISSEYSRFIRTPQVEVSLKSYSASRVSIIGEVAKPGMYPLKRKGQLLTELLSEAGGRTQVAGNRLILLPAQTVSAPSNEPHDAHTPRIMLASTRQPHVSGVEIEFESLLGSLDQQPLLVPLLPGDTIVVPEAGNYDVDGEVAKPGSFKLATRTSVMSAIAAAGGFTYAASVNQVEVIRDIGSGRKALVTLDLEEVGLRGGRDIRLRNGDIVRVPSEPNRFFRQQIVETINGLFNGVGVNQRVN
jgi:polysaccharide export outer membrane protein